MINEQLVSKNNKLKSLAFVFCGGRNLRMNSFSRIPKQLLKINNIPIIETIIQNLEKTEQITKIVLVVGYRWKKFEYLTKKYKNIVLLKNKNYTVELKGDFFKKIKLFWKKKQNCFLINGDMLMPENYFLKNNDKSFVSGFMYNNEKKTEIVSLKINQAKEVIDAAVVDQQNVIRMGEFAMLEDEFMEKIFTLIDLNDPMIKNNLLYKVIINLSVKLNHSLKLQLEKWIGMADIDSPEDIIWIRKKWQN